MEFTGNTADSAQIEDRNVLDTRQFQLVIKRLADSLSYGNDKSHFLGSGLEYAQSRPYEPGDPVRSIDWRVTGRTGRYFVKEYESPKRIPVYLMLDTSASMTISSTIRSKYETALFIAGGLAHACLDRGSPVGMMGAGKRGVHVKPSLSKAQIMQWLMQLRTYRFDETTHLGSRISQLTPSLKERVLLIVLSDMHDPKALKTLTSFGGQHDCALLQLQDPAEVSMRGAGLIRAQEAETGDTFATHGRRQHLMQEDLERGLKRGGIDHLLIRTDQSYAARLRQFLDSRGLLTRGAR